jgi:SAM-dependent methyltransferase
MTAEAGGALSSGAADSKAAWLTFLREEVLPTSKQLDERMQEVLRQHGAAEAVRFLISSKDFRKKHSDIFAGVGYDYVLRRIDVEVPEPQLLELFARVKGEWQRLGKDDPHWSVLSDEKFRDANLDASRGAFFRSGEHEARRIFRGLLRQGISLPFDVAVEYGCGLGRVSLALAPHCGTLYAFDISASHLQLAQENADNRGIKNIQFELVHSPTQPLKHRYDFFYSALVFQHNPPPLIAHLIREALKGLKKGGVAVFQVPVWRKGYTFCITDYLQLSPSGIEMHCIPQRAVFKIIRESECELVDCFETSISLRDRILSNIFTVLRS